WCRATSLARRIAWNAARRPQVGPLQWGQIKPDRYTERGYLVLKRASASRPSGEWSHDDYDVLADGVVVGPHLQGKRRAGRDGMAVEGTRRPNFARCVYRKPHPF